MTKIITATLIGMSMLAATSTFAKNYDIPPSETKILNGPTVYGQTTYVCEVRTESAHASEVDFIAVKNRSIINNIILEEGKATTSTISAGRTFKIEINAHGRLSIFNKGQDLINIDCQD